MTWRKRIVALIVLTVLVSFLGAPPVVWAQETEEWDKPTGTEILFDLVIARPLGFVGVALGSTVFVASLPFTVAVGRVDDTADALVGEPYNFTFVRDLGDY